MLIYIFYALIAAYAVAILFPETALGQKLRAVLIEGLAQHLNRMTWSCAAYLVVFAVGVFAFSFAAWPVEIALMAAADWALYAEIFAALTLTGMSARLGAVASTFMRFVRTGVSMVWRSSTRPRARSRKVAGLRRSPRSSSDEDRAGLGTHWATV